MTKHKNHSENNSFDLANGMAGQIGAWVLTAAALLATTEMLHHNEHAAIPQTGNGHSGNYAAAEPTVARAEGAKETARLPEEYDVGLRMPAISGS